MGQWCCKGCGRPEWGWVFWRIRNANGGHVTDRPNLADCRRILRTYPWAKGCKIYRVTRTKRAARCYWPPMQSESPLESLRAVPQTTPEVLTLAAMYLFAQQQGIDRRNLKKLRREWDKWHPSVHAALRAQILRSENAVLWAMQRQSTETKGDQRT